VLKTGKNQVSLRDYRQDSEGANHKSRGRKRPVASTRPQKGKSQEPLRGCAIYMVQNPVGIF